MKFDNRRSHRDRATREQRERGTTRMKGLPIVRAAAIACGLALGLSLTIVAPVHAGCGDGELDSGEQCDPPGAACVNPTTLASGTCSSSCTCDLPQCGGDCAGRCNDVRKSCEREAEKLRGVQRNACKNNERNAKQLCDEVEVTSLLACSGFCPGSDEDRNCRRSAKTSRKTCRDAAKLARDDCKSLADQVRQLAKDACDDARAQCESTCN